LRAAFSTDIYEVLPTLVLIASLTAPAIEFTRVAAPPEAPVRIDECGATRDGLDLVYRFDLSNASDKDVERVEVAFVFTNPGERNPRATQHLQIARELEPGQSLRFSTDTSVIRRADVSRGARVGACSVVAVSFSDGTRVELPPSTAAPAAPGPLPARSPVAPAATPAT